MRDAATGRPISIDDHPDKSRFASGGDHIDDPTSPAFTIDDSHQPSLLWVAYLLTGDLYYLEGLNYQAAWCLANMHFGRSVGYGRQLPIGPGTQARGTAWSLRTIFQAAKVSPATEAADTTGLLLGADYFNDKLSNTRDGFVGDMVDSTDPIQTLFRMYGSSGSPNLRHGHWMFSFVSGILGWAVSMGFTGAHDGGEWDTVLEWQLGLQEALIGGTSGWVKWVIPYQMYCKDDSDVTFTTYTDAYDFRLTTANEVPPRSPEPTKLYTDDGTGGNTIEDGLLDYPMHVRMAVVGALMNGKTSPDWQSMYDWFHPEIVASADRRDAIGTSSCNAKYAWTPPA